MLNASICTAADEFPEEIQKDGRDSSRTSTKLTSRYKICTKCDETYFYWGPTVKIVNNSKQNCEQNSQNCDHSI